MAGEAMFFLFVVAFVATVIRAGRRAAFVTCHMLDAEGVNTAGLSAQNGRQWAHFELRDRSRLVGYMSVERRGGLALIHVSITRPVNRSAVKAVLRLFREYLETREGATKTAILFRSAEGRRKYADD